jgi:branched-chain amino acid transport system ATP-binding protein
VVREIFRIIRLFNEEERLTIMLVEQNAHLALEIAHAGYLLETGTIALSGAAELLRQSPMVQGVYLGAPA